LKLLVEFAGHNNSIGCGFVIGGGREM